jgi:hypothetical protein
MLNIKKIFSPSTSHILKGLLKSGNVFSETRMFKNWPGLINRAISGE